MTRSIAIIPARGGSKRIPQKNIADFCGNPLIAYSIEAARNSELFDTIHVSTDDRAIADVAAKCGVPVDFMRPDELADDHTPLVPVMRWVLQEYARRDQKFDDVCLLMPCAPLIEPEDLIGAHDIFVARGKNLPVISAAQYPVPVEWAYELDADGVLDPREPGMFVVRSQDLTKKYYDSGMFSLFRAEQILQESFIGGGKMFPYVLPRDRAIDIDEPEDMAFAEKIFRDRQKTDG